MQEIEIKIKTNLDEELKKAKELVALLRKSTEEFQKVDIALSEQTPIKLICENKKENLGYIDSLDKKRLKERINSLVDINNIKEIQIIYKTSSNKNVKGGKT